MAKVSLVVFFLDLKGILFSFLFFLNSKDNVSVHLSYMAFILVIV